MTLQLQVLLITLITGYIIGSIPFGYILTKLFVKKDLRQFGSGNVGMTNTLRTAGKIPAILTLILDASKPIIAGLIAWEIINYSLGGLTSIVYLAGKLTELKTSVIFLTGIFAIIGHCYSIWLGFKGGKGAASTLGLMTFINPALALSAVGVWLIAFNITHFVSLATICKLIAYPTLAYFMHIEYFSPLIYMIIFLSVFGIIMHGKNIKNLLKHSERKTYIFKNTNK